MCVKKKKGGAWERKSRMNEMTERRKDKNEKENSKARISNKRGFH